MIYFDVLNRFTGKVNFTARIDCDESAPRSVKLRLAVLFGIKNSADLHSADLRLANLHSADLRSADLRSADLRLADLHSADLRLADLHSADLRSADLRLANLRLGKNIGSRIIYLSHLRYYIFAYVAKRKGHISMCMEIGCEKHTVASFERKYKDGDFDNEAKFIEEAMPYLEAIKNDLKKIKSEVPE